MIGGGLRRYGFGVLLLALLAAWATWLLLQRKNLIDYLVEQARAKPMLPLCEWVPLDSPHFATLGFSMADTSVWKWTNQKRAMVAFRAHTAPDSPKYVEVGVVAIVGRGVTVFSDGRHRTKIPNEALSHADALQLPLVPGASDDVHVIGFTISRPKAPHGREQRWLGIAVSKIRVCGQPDGS